MTGQIDTFFHEDTNSLTYILHDGPGTEAAIIDSVLDYDPAPGRIGTEYADRIIAAVKGLDLKVKYLLETHIHADHLTAAKYLRSELGGEIVIGKNAPIVQKEWSGRFNEDLDKVVQKADFQHLLGEGDTLMLNGRPIGVIDTPGHTPSCITYTYDNKAIIGDTLFMPDYGTARCDFPGGNAGTLYASLQKILALPDETEIYVCHDYMPGGRDVAWKTTVAEQKAKNIHLTANKTADAFVKFRAERDATLAAPRLLIPSLQVNMCGGSLPDAEDNGTVYLKTPISGAPDSVK